MRLALCLSLLAFALSVCCSGAAFAAPLQLTGTPSDGVPPMQRRNPAPQRQAKALARKLQLTAQQTAAIEPILQQRMQQMEQLRSNSSMDPRARRRQMRGIRQDSERQLRAVLSDHQLQLYEQLRQDMRQRHLEQKASAGEGDDAG